MRNKELERRVLGYLQEVEINRSCVYVNKCKDQIIESFVKNPEILMYQIPCQGCVVTVYCLPSSDGEGCDLVFDDGDNTIFYDSKLLIWTSDITNFNNILATAGEFVQA